jgi:hypothetical protein
LIKLFLKIIINLDNTNYKLTKPVHKRTDLPLLDSKTSLARETGRS